MKLYKIVRHGAYALSTVILFQSFLFLITDCFHITESYKILFYGLSGIISLYLGLFTFEKGLALGLTISGAMSVIFSFWYSNWQLNDILILGIVTIMITIVSVALRNLHKNNLNN